MERLFVFHPAAIVGERLAASAAPRFAPVDAEPPKPRPRLREKLVRRVAPRPATLAAPATLR